MRVLTLRGPCCRCLELYLPWAAVGALVLLGTDPRPRRAGRVRQRKDHGLSHLGGIRQLPFRT